MSNKRQRANRRLANLRRAVTTLPNDVAQQPRVPLAGFESLYEITRTGEVYSLRKLGFIAHKFYNNRAYIEFQIAGEKHQLDIQEAVKASWAKATPRLFRVEVPAATLVILAHDEREALKLAPGALADQVKERQVVPTAAPVQTVADVPEGWEDGYPYAPDGVDVFDRTIRERLLERSVVIERVHVTFPLW